MTPEEREEAAAARHERDEKINAACAALGVDVAPWQRQILHAVLSDQEFVAYRGRRGGWVTLQRVVGQIVDES